jgi:hypothetical protein
VCPKLTRTRKKADFGKGFGKEGENKEGEGADAAASIGGEAADAEFDSEELSDAESESIFRDVEVEEEVENQADANTGENEDGTTITRTDKKGGEAPKRGAGYRNTHKPRKARWQTEGRGGKVKKA